MDIRISAAVCTLNRALYLRKALSSLTNQSLPRNQYEILVVDNGSTDFTRQVVQEQFSLAENLQYFYEPVVGLSQARNTAWQNARGEYVAYLDDDAIACSSWLESILDVFERVKPKPGCVGGRVEPIWEAPRPAWLSNKMVPYLTVVDWSKSPTNLGKNEWLAGANMAFPRDVLESVGGFQLYLGRKGSKLLSMEEILLQRYLQGKGYSCFYHPEISVQHHILTSRLTKSWFLRRVYWQGVSDAVVQIYRESPSAMERLRIGISVVRRILLSRRQLLALTVPTNNPNHFTQKCSTLERIGYVLGLWGMAK